MLSYQLFSEPIVKRLSQIYQQPPLSLSYHSLLGGVVANEPESARRRRLRNVLRTYLGVDRGNSDTVRVTAEDGRQWGQMEPETYDKVRP